MDILTFILAISVASGFLLASFPAKVKRKDEKHRIVRKLRSKAHQYEWVSDIAKDAQPSEIKVLEHMNQWLLDVADEVEEL